MREYITYQRNKPDTTYGESITFTQNYSSFDKVTIDALEAWAKKNIGSGIILERPDAGEEAEV